MKNLKTLALIIAAIGFALLPLLLFTGCAPMERALYQPQLSTMPAAIIATNTTTATNYTVTATPAGPVTNASVQTVISYDYAPAVTVTNLVERPAIAAATQAIGALPVPFAGTAAALLGWLYSAYAAARNRKLSVALVRGVEAYREWSQTTPEGQSADARLKDFLIQHQEAAGVLNAAGKLVNDYTGNTVR